MDAPSTSTNAGSQNRQKRILPSRSRRGGPGVGNCDVDLMILDTQKRRFENEPLIPVETQFLLTTSPAIVSQAVPITQLGLNAHANERYFERPEVLKAYREQQIIQTPDFVNTIEVPTVGGRFRARNSDDGSIDTSDTAYEKRHRKYETFEKRQRLREKEKLKHEQYKLKERIEQLRAMDGAAFMQLPATSFSPAPVQPIDNSQSEDMENVNVNGESGYTEGERRRKEMLDVAQMLEERYRVLLPPERIRKTPGQNLLSTIVGSVVTSKADRYIRDQPDLESEEEDFAGAAQKRVEKIKLKIKFPKRPQTTSTHSSAVLNHVSSKTRRKSILPTPTQPFTPRRIRASYDPTHEPVPLPISETSNQSISDLQPYQRPGAQQVFSPELVDNGQFDLQQVADIALSDTAEASGEVATKLPLSPAGDQENESLSLVETPAGMTSPPVPPLALPFDMPTSPAPFLPPVINEANTSWPSSPMSNPEIAVLEMSPAEITIHEEPQAQSYGPIYVSRPAKRTKPPTRPRNLTREPSIPPIESISAPAIRRSVSRPATNHLSYVSAAGKIERTSCLLMIAAKRSSGSNARRAQRHLSAFGGDLHEIFDGQREQEFRLPSWVRASSVFDALQQGTSSGLS